MRTIHNLPHHDREFGPQPATTDAQSADASETVASYLNKRLSEIGVRHVFAIPGDYVAEWVKTLDDKTQNAGLIRVHPNNEMCAAYAADGYGRVGGLIPGTTVSPVGCVAFTYGVGAINAAQAVAGAFVEQSPVVVINGSPSTAQFNSDRDQGVRYHHMINGSHTDLRIFREITAMAVRIDNPATAPELIDAALATCLATSQPVYIELSNTIESQPCRSATTSLLAAGPGPSSAKSVQEATSAVLQHINASKKLVVIAGSEVARIGEQDLLAEFLQLVDAPYVTSPLGKSVLSEFRDDVRFEGVYFGRSSPDNVQQLLKSADCIVALGVKDTDFNYLGVVTPDYDPTKESGLPGPTHIQARGGAVLVGRGLAYWGDVALGDFLKALVAGVGTAGDRAVSQMPASPDRLPIPEPTIYGADDPITYDSFKSQLFHEFLTKHGGRDYPQIIADAGFSFLSNIDLPAAQSGFVSQLAWAAIGYGVGATAGVTLANELVGRNRRTVTLTGDGAFSQTVNAIGTVAQLGQDAVIFVMDNRVFAVEQWLIDANAFCAQDAPAFEQLTEVPQGHIWDYVKVAEGFGGRGFAVSTNAELATVLAQLQEVPLGPVTKKPTFTLVAVRLPATSLPENARWKMNCA